MLRRPVEALAQRRPPHLDQRASARTATSATRSCGHVRDSRGTRSTSPSPLYNTLLGAAVRVGRRGPRDRLREAGRRHHGAERPTQLELLRGFGRKACRRWSRTTCCGRRSPGPGFRLRRSAADAVANLIRNIWSYMIIFCGHFPDGVHVFTDARSSKTRRGPAGTSASCSARATSRAGRCSTCSPATSATRSSTTCSPTCRATATRRWRPGSEALCARYGLPYNRARCRGSSARPPARSGATPCPAARTPRGGGGRVVQAK